MFILNLFWAAFCSELQFLVCVKIFNFESTCKMPGRPMTEEQKRKKTTRTTERYTSNSLKLVEEGTPQILFLDTKPFVISTDELFQVDAYL